VFFLLFPLTTLAETRYSEESVVSTIRNVFADLGNANQMIAISKCESGFNNTVNILDTNKKRSVGIFQLNGENSVEDWDIPYNNAKKARELYLNGSYRHWKNCSIKLGLLGAT